MLSVEHRKDGLLQRAASEGCSEELKDTFIGTVTIPAHTALAEFLDKELVGKEFADQESIAQALKLWPAFYSKKADRTHKGFENLFITGDGSIAAPGGAGGIFVVGHIA